jgi:hypothetical protein
MLAGAEVPVGCADDELLSSADKPSLELTTRDGQVQALLTFYRENAVNKPEPEVVAIINARRQENPAMTPVQWETMCMALAKKYGGNRPPAGEVDAPREVLHTFICEHEVKQDVAAGKEYVLYGARVSIRCASGKVAEWWIFRRYSDWLELKSVLSEVGGCPKPPPKRLWKTDSNVVAKRKVELNRWLAEVCSQPGLSSSPELIAWLRMGDLQRGAEVARAAAAASAGTRTSRASSAPNHARGACVGRSSVSLAAIDVKITVPSVEFKEDAGAGSATFLFTVRVDSTMVPGWELTKRFSQFVELRAALALKLKTVALPQTPGKRFLVTQAKAETRREQLEQFVQKLLRVPEAAVSAEFLDFLEVPMLLRDALSGAPPTMSGSLHARVEAKAGYVTDDSRYFALRGTGLTWAKAEGNFSDGALDVRNAEISFEPAEEHGISSCTVAILIKSRDVGRMLLSAEADETVRSWAEALLEACGKRDELAEPIRGAGAELLRMKSSTSALVERESFSAVGQAGASPDRLDQTESSEQVESALAWRYWAPEGGWKVDPRTSVRLDSEACEDLVSNARDVEVESKADNMLPSHVMKTGKKMVRLYDLELCKKNAGGVVVRWAVARRFRDFVQLRQSLMASDPQVRQTPSWPRSWANFSLF